MCRIFTFSVFSFFILWEKVLVCAFTVSMLHFYCQFDFIANFQASDFCKQIPTLWFLSTINKKSIHQLTLVIIEHNLKTLEAPQSYQEKNFDEEKIKLIDFRTALASHSQLAWLIPTRKNPECSRNTIKSFNKYFVTGKSACLLCLIYLASFLMFLAFLYCNEFFNGI